MRYHVFALIAVIALAVTGCGEDKVVVVEQKTDVSVPTAPTTPTNTIPTAPPTITPTTPTVTPIVPPVTPTIPTTPTMPVGPTNPTTPTSPTQPTTSTPSTPIATVRAFAPTDVTANSAVLRGQINYVWGPTGTAGFQWIVDTGGEIDWRNGTTEFLGHQSGNVKLPLQDRLRPNTAYAYRLFLATGNANNDTYPSDVVVRFRTYVGVQAVGAVESINGFTPSAKALAVEVLPNALSILVETQGYTNLGEDYVTLHGYVDLPSNLSTNAVIFFQISTDGENWNNWYYVDQTMFDKPVSAPIGGLIPNTAYYYRIGAGFSPENSAYGYSRKFTTLSNSDVRNGQLQEIARLIESIESGVANVKNIASSSSLHPKSVQAFCQTYTDVLVRGQILIDLSSSPDLDGAISEALAQGIIDTSDKVDLLRSSVENYLVNVYRKEVRSPHSTEYVSTATVHLGKAEVGQSLNVGAAQAVEIPIENPRGVEIPTNMLLDVLRGFIVGVNTLVDRTRDVIYANYNVSEPWAENYVSHLANKAFVSARVLHDLVQIPEIKPLVDTNLRRDIQGVDRNIKSLRTELRTFQIRANQSAVSRSINNSDRLQRRYVDGEDPNDQKG